MRERMREAALLLRIQAYRFCGVNALLHGHDRRQKRRALGTLAVALTIAAMAVGYSAMYALALAEMGAAQVIPHVLALATFGLTFVVTAFKGPELIFGGHDVPALRALPVRTSSIVASRLTGVLLPEIAVTLLMGIPAAVVYGINGPGALAAVRLALALCFIPAIPTALALLVGTVVAFATMRMRHRSLVAAVLSIVLIVAVLGGSFALGFAAERGTITETMLLVMLGRAAQLLTGIYPPADWAAEAAGGSALAYVWLAGTAALALLAVVMLATRGFSRISDGLAAGGARRRDGGGRIRAASPLASLYRKERLRYLSSSVYLMNTSVGWLMLLLATGAVCVADIGPYIALVKAMPGIGAQLFWLLPLIPAVLAGMSSTTACSISMEGAQMEQTRALPVTMGAWLGAKLLFHLTLAVPVLTLCAAALTVRLSLTAGQAALLLGYPLSGALLVGVCGLALNLRFPRFDWTQDVQAVKSGASVLLTMLIGMLLPIAAGALAIRLGAAGPVLAAACVAQLGVAGAVWAGLMRARMP